MTPVQHDGKRHSTLHTLASGFGRALTSLRQAAQRANGVIKPVLRRAGRPLQIVARYMPKGLYPRALVIVIAPVVILQSVIAYVFMERHWQLVTQRLSASVSAAYRSRISLPLARARTSPGFRPSPATLV